MMALKKTDLSPIIKMSGLMTPKLINGFLPKLNNKQRIAFDKVMPPDGKKRFFIHLSGTPTPPIMIKMAQPLKMSVVSEEKVKNENIKGLVLTPEILQTAMEKKYGKLIWLIKGQIGTILNLTGMFMPFVALGPKGIKDMQNKAMTHFKPLMDMVPGSKRY
jgi:hypothetical protein